MSKFFISASGLDARGVGPRIMLRTIPIVLVAIVLGFFAPERIKMNFIDSMFVKTVGWIWFSAGIATFIASLAQFIANFPKGQLITKGMFACSRNPIYATWIVLILPALGLILNNWLFFAASIVMCRATLYLIKEEERDLQQVFGEKYIEYKNKVGSIVRFI